MPAQLDAHEVKKCLKLCKIELSPEQQKKLIDACDEDGDGNVDYDEFLKLVRGPLPIRRRRIVVEVFKAIDNRAGAQSRGGRSDGKLTIDDLMDVYSSKTHPEVQAGRKSESAMLREMLETFEGRKGNRDGIVTLDEWMNYYEELSASIDNDDHFNLMVSGAWAKLFEGKDASLRKPLPAGKIDEIEKRLIDAIRARSNGVSETRALESVFKQFDTDKSGCIDFHEFQRAMERFGLATGGHYSGCTVELIMALFDRHDPDGSGELSYSEFIKGLFPSEAAVLSARPAGGSPQRAPPPAADGTSLMLPSERAGEEARPPTADGYYGRGKE